MVESNRLRLPFWEPWFWEASIINIDGEVCFRQFWGFHFGNPNVEEPNLSRLWALKECCVFCSCIGLDFGPGKTLVILLNGRSICRIPRLPSGGNVPPWCKDGALRPILPTVYPFNLQRWRGTTNPLQEQSTNGKSIWCLPNSQATIRGERSPWCKDGALRPILPTVNWFFLC